MTAITLPKTGISTGYLPGENDWGTAMNRNLRTLDALVNLTVVDKDLDEPPVFAAGGDVYIVGPSAAASWSGYAGYLAVWCEGDDLADSEWNFVLPQEAWRAWVTDESAFYQYVSGAWVKDSTSTITPRNFETVIGDGSTSTFYVDHNLETRNVHVSVYRNGSPWNSIACDIARYSENTIELSGFAVEPGVDELVVAVSR